MRGKGWFPSALGRRAPSAGVALLLVVLGALPVAVPWTGAAMADTRVAMSGGPRPGPIQLGAPMPSPAGAHSWDFQADLERDPRLCRHGVVGIRGK